MKKFLYLLPLIGFFSCSSNQDVPFTVEGTIKNGNIKTVFLEESKTNREKPVVVDSAIIAKDGSFKLNAREKEENLFTLRGDNQEFPFAVLVNDAKKITVHADLSAHGEIYEVKGSDASQKILDFDKKLTGQASYMYQVANELDSLGTSSSSDTMSRKVKDSTRAALYNQLQATVDEMKNYTTNLIDNSNSPTLVIYAYDLYQRMMQQFQMKGFNQTETVAIVNKLSSRFPDNSAVKDWKKSTGTGKAPDFTLPDTSGRSVSLSSFRGKYVLIDFWASWCGPCRQENPNVVAVYNQFRDKNFTILGVSLDQNKDAWLKAIHDDGLIWNHVSDLKFWNSEAASLYNVNGIPYNFLVDPNGNIVAENIRGEELAATLSKFLK
jgi:peroxiredoxin